MESNLESTLGELISNSDSFFTPSEAAMIDQESGRRSHPEDLALIQEWNMRRSPEHAREIATAHTSASPALSQASTSASAFPTAKLATADQPQFASMDVSCGTCGSTVYFERARCRSKMQQRWVCRKCGVKLSTLRKSFGTWPPSGFNKISKEEQQAFFCDNHGLSGAAIATKADHMFNIKEEQQAQYYQNGGEFLPLGAWATRGFDANVIKEKIAQEDCREHLILGTTYRVKILSMGDRGEKLTRARQVLTERKAKRSKIEAEGENAQSDAGEDKDEDKKGAKATSVAQKAEKDDKDDSDADNYSIDSDASSDDSSSNSSSGKKIRRTNKKQEEQDIVK